MIEIQRSTGLTEPVLCHICGRPLGRDVEYIITQRRTDRTGVYTVTYAHMSCDMMMRQRSKNGWPQRAGKGS